MIRNKNLRKQLFPFLLWKNAAICLSGMFCILYVGLGLSPSSYGCFLNMLSAPNEGLLLGHCQPWRSDEYMVLTPYFQISVLNNFGGVDLLSPYKESLQSFFALPTLDWGLLFRPQVWLFHVLPAAQAYSAYWLIMTLSFLGSFYTLLRLVGLAPLLSILGALLLFFSQFIQLWWTMNAGVFAFIGWVGVAVLADLSPLKRFLAVFLSTTVTLFALLYPPFLIAGGFALGIFCIALKPSRFSDMRAIACMIAGLTLAVGLAVVYQWDLIVALRDTVYPGQRRSTGGSFSLIQLLGHLFPYITTIELGDQGVPVFAKSNPIEISVMGSWLPLMLMIFVRWASVGAVVRNNLRTILIFSLGLIFMLLWLFTGLLDFFSSILLLAFVPPQRMIYGFGLLSSLATIYFCSKIEFSISRWRVLIFISTALFAWLCSSLISDAKNIPEVLTGDADDLLVIPIMIVILFIFSRKKMSKLCRLDEVVLVIAVITSALTFGIFNPLQRTSSIFEKPVSPLIMALDSIKEKSPNTSFSLVGHFGAGLVGLGYPTINHVLLYPQLRFFRTFYPKMDETVFNKTFNRYAHVIVDGDLLVPRNQLGDTINLPGKDFGSYHAPCDGKLPRGFDITLYLKFNPDVKAAGIDPIQHYLGYGCHEGRSYGYPFVLTPMGQAK